VNHDRNEISTDPVPRHGPFDVDILCPHCDYNVRGTPEDRCPECGRHFDRSRLYRWTTKIGLSASFTRSGKPYPSNSAFVASMLTPSRLAQELPPLVNAGKAGFVAWGMRFNGCLACAILTTVLRRNPDGLFLGIIVGYLLVASLLIGEWLILFALTRWIDPKAVPRDRRYRFWRALLYCFSPYFVVVCVLAPMVLLSKHFLWAIGSVIAWWYVTVIVALRARTAPESSWRLTASLISMTAMLVLMAGCLLLGV